MSTSTESRPRLVPSVKSRQSPEKLFANQSVSVEEAAAYFNVCAETIRRWIRLRRLPAQKPAWAKKYRIPLHALDMDAKYRKTPDL